MIEDLPPGVRRMLAAAASHTLTVEVRRRPPASSLEEAAAGLGIEPSAIAKTMVVKLPRDAYLLAVIAGDSQIAWPKLRGRLGVNKMSLPPAEVALRATGYERGTITPIGSEPSWPVYVDERLVGRRVAMGAGAPGFSAFLEVDELVRAYGAVVADLVT